MVAQTITREAVIDNESSTKYYLALTVLFGYPALSSSVLMCNSEANSPCLSQYRHHQSPDTERRR